MKLKPVRFQQTRQGVRDLDQWKDPPFPASGGPIPASARPNLSEWERALSFIAGAGLIGASLAQKSIGGLFLGFVGTALVQRGWTGHCSLYQAIGRNSADPAQSPQEMAYVPN